LAKKNFPQKRHLKGVDLKQNFEGRGYIVCSPYPPKLMYACLNIQFQFVVKDMDDVTDSVDVTDLSTATAKIEDENRLKISEEFDYKQVSIFEDFSNFFKSPACRRVSEQQGRLIRRGMNWFRWSLRFLKIL